MSENFQSLEKSGAEISKEWKSRVHRIAGTIFFYAVAVAAFVFAGLLLYSVRCAISNVRFDPLGDGARYANMMWNTAHGRPFLYDAGAESYLRVHLSFTLGAAAFLWRVVDHPLMPAFLQWALAMGGGIFLVLAAVRARLPRAMTAVLLLYWTGYYFVQSVLLSGFHGVSFYLLLVPMLYYAMARGLPVWPVFIAILGLREEAGLMIAPLLFYFASRHSWRAGRIYGGVALLYVVLAMTVLFPMINGLSIFERRAADMNLLEQADPHRWVKTAESVMWVALPMLGLLRRGWRPLLIIPSVALLTALASGHSRQVALASHYPALVHALIAVALIEAAQGGRDVGASPARRPWRSLIAPAWLVIATLTSHYVRGFLPGSASVPNGSDLFYKTTQPAGRHALKVAQKKIPRTGVLATEPALAMFVANRADLLWYGFHTNSAIWRDIVFCRRKTLPAPLREKLSAGEWGVLFFDDKYIVLRNHAPVAQNAAFLATLGKPGSENFQPLEISTRE